MSSRPAGHPGPNHVASLTVVDSITKIPFALEGDESTGALNITGTIAVDTTGLATEAKQDTLIGHVDGIEALLTTIDADTSNLAAILTGVDGIEGLLTTIDGRVDGIEALIGTTNSTLSTIDGRVDGLEGLQTTANASLSVLDDWDESDRAKVNPIAGQAGVAAGAGAVSALTQRVTTAYDTGWLTARARYTGAQTNTAVITAGASDIIIVKKLTITADGANTNASTGAITGFHSSTTPTGAGAIASHPGIAAGSGLSEFYGESGVASQVAGDDLRITSEDPGGNLDIVVIYKIVT